MPRVTAKGQVTIPKEIRDALGIEAGDEVAFEKYRGSADSDETMTGRASTSWRVFPRC